MPSKFSNPFFWLSAHSHKRVVIILGILTIVLIVVLNILDQPLKNPHAPSGIISFELAKGFIQSQVILASWDPISKLYAALSLGIDFLFLVTYSLFLSLSCIKLSEKFIGHKDWFSRIGVLFAWAQLLAAILDAIENYGLIRLLLGSQRELFSTLACYCAAVKFFFIFLGIFYLVLGLFILLVLRIRASK